jgi:hypothetical protein
VTDELTPEQEDAVRRLLSQARHDGPLPGDVADRLDQVLEGLVAGAETDADVDDLEVFESGGQAAVTELAGVRRRRRNAGRLLFAAAAVLIGGVAVGQNLGAGAGDSDDGADAANSTLGEAPRDSPNRSQEEADSAAGGGVSGADPSEPVAPEVPTLLESVRAPLSLTSDNFAADVQLQLGRTADQRRQAANAGFDGVLAYVAENRDFQCADGAYGEGATLPAYYDAEEAVLVLRRPRSGIQRVDLLTCGTAVQLNSVELPAP